LLAALALACLPAAGAAPEKLIEFWPPCPGRVTDGFGWRQNPFGGGGQNFHTGIDIAAKVGTPVRAVAGGTAKAGQDPAWGNYVIVRDGDVEYHYYHLSRVIVKNLEEVKTGKVIGYVGSTGASTGPHLHFAVKRCLDPFQILKNQGGK